MALFSPVGSSTVTTTPGTSERATNPQTVEVNMPTPNTEYSFALPAGCKQFMIRTANGNRFSYSYVAAGSANGFPVPWQCFYSESDLLTSSVLYFQSPVAEVMKITVWT